MIPYLNQIVIVLAVIIITTLLVVTGIQVFHILKEFLQTVKKVNKILDDTEIISSSVAKPIQGVSGFLMGLKSGMDVIKCLVDKGDKGERRECR